jgi:hypothetical protein
MTIRRPITLWREVRLLGITWQLWLGLSPLYFTLLRLRLGDMDDESWPDLIVILEIGLLWLTLRLSAWTGAPPVYLEESK